ncbi:MAG: hypothetical protein RJQ09_03290 [Cyclobacteriaceae bacterium]
MKLNLYQTLNALVLGLSVLLWSCGGGSESSDSGEGSESSEFDSAQDQVNQEIDRVVHELPPPTEVPLLLQQVGADFNSKVANDIDKVDGYQSNDKAALNLGVYATDVGYFASYEQVQDALKYMDGCQKLADYLGIASAFDVSLLRRFEQNIGNRDSLAVLVNQAMVQAEEQLESNSRTKIAALALAGSYIEGLYISTQVIKNYPTDLPPEARNLVLEPLIRLVADQQKPLLDLIGVLKNIEQDEIVENMEVEMGVLRFYYDEIGDIEKKISEDAAHVVLDEGLLKDITNEIARIREQIIS